MTIRSKLATILLLTVAVTAARAEQLLWDNYPGGLDGLQDVNFNMSSERNTSVYEPTWIVDDVDLLQVPRAEPSELVLTRLEWVGARMPQYSYPAVDVILLDSDFNTLTEFSDLAYTFTDHDSDLEEPGWQLYEGEVSLADMEMPTLPEHFYIGVRLVGQNYLGRNRNVTSTIDTTYMGRTQGHMKASIFGAPDWTPASEVWYAPPTDHQFEFAFRLHAIPEPAGLALLAIGSVVFLRRR